MNIDASRLSDEARRRLVEALVDRLGLAGASKAIGISRSYLYELVRGFKKVQPWIAGKAIELLGEEVKRILGAEEVLRGCGVIGETGFDRSFAAEILKLSLRDEILRNVLIEFVTKHFREELRKILGIVPEKIVLRWDPEFEEFLKERKKRRKIATEETLKYYRSLFMKYLEGRELSRELAEEVAKHRNKWLRNVFRHYIQYLFYKRAISGETYGWIMEYVPSRSYKVEPRAYEISIEDLRKTLEYLRKKHELYYTIYLLMLYSGARLQHALKLIREWNPDQVVYIPMLDRESRRLVCFEGFCRYYLGLRGGSKPCEWVYMPKELVQMIERHRGVRRSRTLVERYAKRHGLIQPKMLRKINWRIVASAMERDAARFMQSRFGELAISEALYENLLEKTDRQYPKALEELRRIVGFL
ncbi:integrase protein [Desulfurococcaceae archaeon AG1]|nr:integrase protein [Desulfurococcaceae archaeon AG1]